MKKLPSSKLTKRPVNFMRLEFLHVAPTSETRYTIFFKQLHVRTIFPQPDANPKSEPA